MKRATFVSRKAFLVIMMRAPKSNGNNVAKFNLKPRRKGSNSCLISSLPVTGNIEKMP
jgi:hypothetical protein